MYQTLCPDAQHGLSANEDGMRLNKYTIVMDIKVDLALLQDNVSLFRTAWNDESTRDSDE